MRRAALAVALLSLAGTRAFGWGRASAPAWLKAEARAPLSPITAGAAGVCLLDETTTAVAENGAIVTTHRAAYKILSTEGRELGYAAVHTDGTSRLDSFRAWSIAPNGDEYEVRENDAYETNAFDGQLYADAKLKVIKIPAAEPGTVFAYESVQRQAQPQALQDAWHFQQNVPVARARYALVLPAGWTHQERWINFAAEAPQAGAWELRDVPAVKEEPGSPPFAAVAGRMAVNFIPPAGGAAPRSWADFGRWYARLSDARRAPTPAMQAKVRELTAPAPTTLEKMRALSLFAQRDVRYVAIEIGIGGYQPHAAGEIFANRYGDCKDKVTALSAMLREIGVESYYVIISTYRGVVDRQFASLEGFNHAVIAIRLPDDVKSAALQGVISHPSLGRLLLFDPTDDMTPLGRLPWYLQGNSGLLVTPGGGELIDLPAQQPETNRLTRTAKLQMDREGTLSGTVTEVRSGTLAAAARAQIRAMKTAERQKFIETSVAAHLADFKVGDLAVENLDDLEKDLVVRYTLSAPRYLKVAGNLLLVRPRVLGRKAEAMIDLKERKHGYQTDGPSLQVDEVEIATPAGLVLDELPPPAVITTPALSYTSEAKFEADVLRYRREYRVQALDVPLAALPELNKAFAQILADERGSAVFRNR